MKVQYRCDTCSYICNSIEDMLEHESQNKAFKDKYPIGAPIVFSNGETPLRLTIGRIRDYFYKGLNCPSKYQCCQAEYVLVNTYETNVYVPNVIVLKGYMEVACALANLMLAANIKELP